MKIPGYKVFSRSGHAHGPWPVLTTFALMAVAVLIMRTRSNAQQQPPGATSSAGDTAAQIAALRAELNEVKGKVPDQSHSMSDVGYHFANLWFAGSQKNWPLAKFYLDETRSHLRWAVRIIPVRKTPEGADLELKGILDGVDSSLLSQIQKAIDARDADAFATTYKQSLEGCYACHKAAGKPYLRPQVPEVPPQPIINFDPNANWPE